MLAAAILSSSFGDDANQVSEQKLLVKLILDAVTLGLLGVNFKVFEMPQFRHLGHKKYFQKVDNKVDTLQILAQILTVSMTAMMFSNPDAEGFYQFDCAARWSQGFAVLFAVFKVLNFLRCIPGYRSTIYLIA